LIGLERLHSHTFITNTHLFNFFTANFTAELDETGEDYIFLDYKNEVDAEIALENLKPKTLSLDDF